MAGPYFRIKLYNKTTKKSCDIGVAWLNDNGSISFDFEKHSDFEAKYPKVNLEDAMKLLQKDGVSISFWPGDRDEEFSLMRPKGGSSGGGFGGPVDGGLSGGKAGEFSDDDLPF